MTKVNGVTAVDLIAGAEETNTEALALLFVLVTGILPPTAKSVVVLLMAAQELADALDLDINIDKAVTLTEQEQQVVNEAATLRFLQSLSENSPYNVEVFAVNGAGDPDGDIIAQDQRASDAQSTRW